MITPEVDAREIRNAVKILRTIDKTLVTEMSRGMKSQIKPVGDMVAKDVNAIGAPLSGFRYPSRTMWERVSSKVSVTPGASRAAAGKKNLVSIEIFSGSSGKGKGVQAPGYAIVELAGWKSGGKTAQGVAMIRNLNRKAPGWPRGGRFAYKAFTAHAHDAYVVAKTVLNTWTDSVNAKLENL